jgi:hypothetical protein
MQGVGPMLHGRGRVFMRRPHLNHGQRLAALLHIFEGSRPNFGHGRICIDMRVCPIGGQVGSAGNRPDLFAGLGPFFGLSCHGFCLLFVSKLRPSVRTDRHGKGFADCPRDGLPNSAFRRRVGFVCPLADAVADRDAPDGSFRDAGDDRRSVCRLGKMELMGRYMAEIGLTPASRSRIAVSKASEPEPVDKVEFVIVYQDEQGNRQERALNDTSPVNPPERTLPREGSVRRYELNGDL